MLFPIKVIDIELSEPINSIPGLEAYIGAQIMLRLYGRPVGYITVPVTDGYLDSEVLIRLILTKHTNTIIRIALQNALTRRTPNKEFSLENLFAIKPPASVENLPLVTVAVCTRDRSTDLAQ